MERAGETLRLALSHFDEAGTEVAKSHVLLSLGELQLRVGRYADGIVFVKEAIDLAKRLDERLAQASGQVLLGQLYETGDKHELADKQFRLAIRLLGGLGLRERLAEAHAAYAEVLDARGDGRTASRHWKLAAKLALRRQSIDAPATRAV